jgi:hypothetical protein
MKIVFAALALTLTLAVVPAVGRAVTLDIKTGAWEVTQSTTMSGMPMPKAALEGMPPEQRAKFEAAMRERAGKVKTTVLHTCVTRQDIDRGELLRTENADCKRKVIAQNARHLEIEETCTEPEPRTTHFKFDASSADAYSGSVDVTQGEGGRVHIDMSGRWTGATCEKGDDD